MAMIERTLQIRKLLPASVLGGVCLLGYVVLLFLVFGRVFNDGLCCADDSGGAIISKNFAFGYGYGTSLYFSGRPGLVPFDLNVTSIGPILLLPVAGLIKIFGNEPWVPGLATAIEITLLLALIAWLQFRRAPLAVASSYMLMFGLLCYAVTTPNYWSTALGEMPAALLCVLAGTIVTADTRPRIGHVAIASLLFGLAVMTKHLSILGYVPLGLWLGFNFVAGLPSRAEAFRIAVISVACLLLPSFVFEVWKLLSLGPDGYISNWKEFITYFMSQSGTSQASIMTDRIFRYARVFHDYFGISVWLVLGADLCVAGVVWLTARDRRAGSLALFFVSAAIVHLVWWLFLSLGWPRYILIGLILHAAAASTVVYIMSPALVALITLVVIAIHGPGLNRIPQNVKEALVNGFRENERVAHLREAAAFLTQFESSRPFVSSWWASVADLEYALPTANNFRRFDFLVPTDAERDFVLVRNTFWTNFSVIPEFQVWEKACPEILFDKPPYRISRCPSQKEQFRLLRRLAENPNSRGGPAQIKIVAAKVRLIVPSGSSLSLDVSEADRATLNIAFGIDGATMAAGATTDVCFKITGHSSSGDQTELLNKCATLKKELNPNFEENELILLPPGLTRLNFSIISENSSPTNRFYWSGLTITAAGSPLPVNPAARRQPATPADDSRR